jgi:hypothetical protein
MKNNVIFNDKYKKNNEKGMALIAALIFVFVLVSMGIAILTMAGNDSKLSTLQRESNRAFYLAEKGIEEALWFMNLSPNNQDGINWRVPKTGNPWPSPEDRDSETEYYEVYVDTVPDSIVDGKATEIKIKSTGIVNNSSQYNDGRRTVEVKLQKGTIQNNSLSYNYAILADSFVNILGSVNVNGDIHSNGDVVISGAAFELTNGTLSATGDIDAQIEGISQPAQPIPTVDFNYYYNKAVESGTFYGENTDVVMDSNRLIEGFHYIDGDLTIKPPASEITINDGAIFVTGSIEFQGNPDIIIEHSDAWDNPLSLVAQGNIFGHGTVHGEGIIQSESTINLHGDVDINLGAVVAPEVYVSGNVEIVYDNGLQEEIVVGTGIEVWKKVSWEEI